MNIHAIKIRGGGRGRGNVLQGNSGPKMRGRKAILGNREYRKKVLFFGGNR